MPRPRKIICNNTVLFITTSVEEGFMFPLNPLTELVLLTSLAKAQALHPLEVCAFLFEPTHAHFLVRVDNPDDVRGFMERFKTESAHAVNRLLNRPKRTIWCEGYDSPIIPTIEAVTQKLVYIYEQPSKDCLEDSIECYPGLSSWDAFRSGRTTWKTVFVPRDGFSALPPGYLTHASYRALVRKISRKRKRASFTISPDAWTKCFDITPNELEEVYEDLCSRLREKEKEHRAWRAQAGQALVGARTLSLTPIGAPYTPRSRDGLRMYCHCEDRAVRQEIITWIKTLIADGQEVYERWKRGDYSLSYPLGLYPPAMPKIAEILAIG